MKTLKTFLVVSSVVCLTQVQGLAVVYVDANATGNNNGTSWANAYVTVKTAVDSSPAGTEIWVAVGTYYPSLTTTNRCDSLVLKSGMKLYGGFTSGMASRNVRNWATNPVILSGDINTMNNHTDNSNHILIGAPGAVLDGFTIKNGGDLSHTLSQDGPTNAFGGGLFVADTGASSMKVANCTFNANVVYWDDGDTLNTGFGGAVYATNSALEIVGCIFDDNKAWCRGGAIWVMNPAGGSSYPVVISSCVFRRNLTRMGSGQVGGGGIWASAGSLTVRNCKMIDNHAGINDLCFGDGAAIYLAPGGDGTDTCVIEGTVFAMNMNGSGRGGAVCANRNVTVCDCTFAQNRCLTRARGGALYVAAAATASVSRCVFAGNSTYQNAHFYTWGLNGNYEQGQGGAIAAAGVVLVKNSVFTGNYSASTESRELLSIADNHDGTYTTNVIVKGGIKGGGGAFWQEPGPGGSVLENCTFADNRANQYGGAVFADTLTNDVELRNCIVWGNESWRRFRNETETYDELFGENLEVRYTDIACGWSGSGSNNLEADPLFVASGDENGFSGIWTGAPTYDPATGLTTFTDANASWIPGEHVGRFIEPTTNEVVIACPTNWSADPYTNSVAGLEFLIAGNTATTLSVYGDPRNISSYWRQSPTYAGLGSFYRISDYHLKAVGGHWTPLRQAPSRWVRDQIDSPCLNAGDPESDCSFEPGPNCGRVNLGAYGNTAQASRGQDPAVFLVR